VESGPLTSCSKPYFWFSPPEPNNPAHWIPGFLSLCRAVPIGLTALISSTAIPLPQVDHVLRIRVGLYEILDIKRMLPIRSDQPLYLPHLGDRLGRRGSMRGRDVDEYFGAGEADGGGSAAYGEEAASGLHASISGLLDHAGQRPKPQTRAG